MLKKEPNQVQLALAWWRVSLVQLLRHYAYNCTITSACQLRLKSGLLMTNQNPGILIVMLTLIIIIIIINVHKYLVWFEMGEFRSWCWVLTKDCVPEKFCKSKKKVNTLQLKALLKSEVLSLLESAWCEQTTKHYMWYVQQYSAWILLHISDILKSKKLQ